MSNALTLYARQKHLVHLVEEQVYEHEKTNSAIINILSHIVESRNFESGTHTLHVRAITDILLRQLVAATNRCPLSQADISMISTLSALHGIGKISIPAEILNKPGKLTREEFEIMKTHTTAGDELLQDMPVSHDDPLMRTAHEICRCSNASPPSEPRCTKICSTSRANSTIGSNPTVFRPKCSSSIRCRPTTANCSFCRLRAQTLCFSPNRAAVSNSSTTAG